MIRGLVFDFDGLILDTETPSFRAWQNIYRETGQEIALDDWSRNIGTNPDTFDPCVDLEAKCGHPLDRKGLVERHINVWMEILKDQKPLPGVLGLIDQAKRTGLKVGIASSSNRWWLQDHLTRLGLIDRFDCVKTADDVVERKPHPDLYLEAVKAMGLKPDEAIALEDSPNGVWGAKNAGLYCVAIPNALTGRLDLSHADLILPTLENISLKELISLAEKKCRPDFTPAKEELKK